MKGNEDQLFDVRPTSNGAEVFALFDFDRENPEFGYRRAGSKIVYPVTVKVKITSELWVMYIRQVKILHEIQLRHVMWVTITSALGSGISD